MVPVAGGSKARLFRVERLDDLGGLYEVRGSFWMKLRASDRVVYVGIAILVRWLRTEQHV